MKKYGFALYLSDKGDGDLFPIITNLQNKYDNAPPFEPHLAVHTAVDTDLETAIKVVEKVIHGVRKFTVENVGFGHQDKWSKILYIKIEENKMLSKIHEEIGDGLGALDPRPYIPHISLMYKDELTVQARDKIMANLELSNSFEMKGIEIVSTTDVDFDWRDYSKWIVEYRKDFD